MADLLIGQKAVGTHARHLGAREIGVRVVNHLIGVFQNFLTAAAQLAVRFELEYRPLSQRYIVRNLNSGDQDSFGTLYSALNNLGRIQSLPVIDDALLERNENYRIRVRAMLQTQQYPAPLRLLFFWRSEWQLQSEWFEWLLDR